MANLMNYIRLLAFTALLRNVYGKLNKFISHFEMLDYEPMYKHFRTGRRTFKRSTDNALFIKFQAFEKTFEIILRNDDFVFDSGNNETGGSNRTAFLHPNSLVTAQTGYKQEVQGNGWVTNVGLFYGTVKLQNNTFYIEPAVKYWTKPRFHSIIYRSEDVDFKFNNLEFTKKGRRRPVYKRRRRHASTNPHFINVKPMVCRLSLEADYTFVEMSGSPFHAISSMVAHINALNRIFSNFFIIIDRQDNESVFTLQRNESILQFHVARVKVYNKTETSRILAPGSLDAATFLRLMSNNERYANFCLALFFTARNFTEGVLGVANSGGACTTLNTGVVSFMREGIALPSLITEIAVAHVVGHAFGAKHDQEKENKDGDFIMTQHGVTGYRPNNILYSPSSIQQIKSFVNTTQNMHCLEQVTSKSICGNGIIEDGEECDCGGQQTCGVLEPGNCCNFSSCKLREHAFCSVSNGFCCNGTTCNYKNAGDVCSFEAECSYHSVCLGNTSKCPQAKAKDNFTECNRNSSICINGVCSGKSVCIKFGLEACFCENKLDKCKICCLNKDKCSPAHNITKMKSKVNSVYLNAGSLCSNRRGYCDMFHECHPLNLNAPFSHRYDPYVRKKSIKEITHSFWWAIFLGTVGLIGCVVMIIKHAALYTRSSDPDLNELEPAKPLPRFKLSRLKEEEKGIVSDDAV